METLPYVTTLDTEDASFTQKVPYKICMHLADEASTDFRVMRDAKTLAEAGFEVTIVDLAEDRSLPTEEIIDNVHIKHVLVPGWFKPSRFKPWFLIKLLVMITRGTIQLLKTDTDIYHAHVEQALPACYIAARLRRKPLIFDAPDLTLSDPSLRRWRRLRAFSARFLAGMVSKCAMVITASPYYVPELRALYRAPDVTVLRNVPNYRLVPSSNLLRHHLNLGPEVRIVLYQGNIQANRGLDRLVYAAKFLETNTVIVMMGRAIESTRAQLETLIASEQVAERVKILPAVPQSELLDWTASADIGLTIFPPDYSLSIRFTLPNKLFEYLMAGRPVLSAQLDAIAEIIKTYDVGQVAPSLAPSDLGAAINAMLADSAALARMSKHALEVAQQEFHWEKESLKLVRLYYNILETKGVASHSQLRSDG